jgi:hypothetical protein
MVDHPCDADRWAAMDGAFDPAALRRHARRVRAAWLIAGALAFALGLYLSTAVGELLHPESTFEPAARHGGLAQLA